MTSKTLSTLLVGLSCALAVPALGQQPMQPSMTGLGGARPVTSSTMPNELREVGWDQRLGENVPFDAAWKDSTGRSVTLAELSSGKPLVLVPVYFRCPMLCKLVTTELVKSLADLPFQPGQEYEVVAFSFDPEDGPAEAAEKRETAIRQFGRQGTDDGWHFLTGDAATIGQLTSAIGFRFKKDEQTGEYAHTSGLVVVTPEGRLARYFFGFDFPAKSLRLTLVEASEEKIGSLTDKVLLYCFKYDPETGAYSALTMNTVRLAAVLTVLALAFSIVQMIRRERLRNPKSLGTA